MKDTILVYYSLTGLNEIIADKIKNLIDLDILKLKSDYQYPKQMYPCWDVVRGFRKIKAALPTHNSPVPNSKNLPALKNELPNLSKYKNIIIGGPVWGWTLADPIITYLSQANLAGKNVKSYWTCVNTDYNYEQNFKSLLPQTANYQAGLCIEATISDDPKRLENALNEFLRK